MRSDDTVPTRLIVTDWTLDPHAVIAACTRHVDGRPAAFALLVPAWLHGLDWAGDPTATVPCAEEHLDALRHLYAAAGLDVVASAVGDPDPVAAIADAIAAWHPADVVLFLPRRSRLAARNPLDITTRTRRVTGLAVSQVDVPVRTAGPRSQRRCQPISAPGGAR